MEIDIEVRKTYTLIFTEDEFFVLRRALNEMAAAYIATMPSGVNVPRIVQEIVGIEK